MKTDRSKEEVLIGRVGSPSGLRGEMRITLYAQDSENLKEGKVLLLKHAGVKRDRARDASDGSKASGSSGINSSRSSADKKAGPPPDSGVIKAAIKSVRYQKGTPVIRLEGIEDRNAAEQLRGMQVSIKAGDLEKLPEGEHYVRNLIGCRVVDIAGCIKTDGPCAVSPDNAETCRADGCTSTVPANDSGSAGFANGSDSAGREIGILKDVIQNTAQSILDVETPEGKRVLIPAVDAFLRNIDEESGVIEVELIPGFID